MSVKDEAFGVITKDDVARVRNATYFVITILLIFVKWAVFEYKK